MEEDILNECRPLNEWTHISSYRELGDIYFQISQMLQNQVSFEVLASVGTCTSFVCKCPSCRECNRGGEEGGGEEKEDKRRSEEGGGGESEEKRRRRRRGRKTKKEVGNVGGEIKEEGGGRKEGGGGRGEGGTGKEDRREEGGGMDFCSDQTKSCCLGKKEEEKKEDSYKKKEKCEIEGRKYVEEDKKQKYEEIKKVLNPETGKKVCLCKETRTFNHKHTPHCPHPRIKHSGHIDYIVDNKLHHPHNNHCDDHGEIELIKITQ